MTPNGEHKAQCWLCAGYFRENDPPFTPYHHEEKKFHWHCLTGVCHYCLGAFTDEHPKYSGGGETGWHGDCIKGELASIGEYCATYHGKDHRIVPARETEDEHKE